VLVGVKIASLCLSSPPDWSSPTPDGPLLGILCGLLCLVFDLARLCPGLVAESLAVPLEHFLRCIGTWRQTNSPRLE